MGLTGRCRRARASYPFRSWRPCFGSKSSQASQARFRFDALLGEDGDRLVHGLL